MACVTRWILACASDIKEVSEGAGTVEAPRPTAIRNALMVASQHRREHAPLSAAAARALAADQAAGAPRLEYRSGGAHGRAHAGAGASAGAATRGGPVVPQPDELLREIETLIDRPPVKERLPAANLASWRSTDEVKHAAALAQQYADRGYSTEPLITMLGKIAWRDNFTETHAFKHHQATVGTAVSGQRRY